MRNFWLYIGISIALCSFAKGQVVHIEDANFRSCLAKSYPKLLDVDQNLIIDSAKKYKGSIICANKQIESVPELIYFESLTILELNQNKLQTLPSLDNLKKLTYLYLAENQLTKLPSLDSLKELQQLICWKNQLTDLPNITHMTKLFRLDVPVNKLTKFPALPPTAPLKTILVDDNFIQDLPDLSKYTKLEIVKLVNNQLSFGDLAMLLKQPNPAIYDYYPQKFFNVLVPQNINEGMPLSFNFTIDTISVETSTQWFKNNVLFSESNTLQINSSTLSDSGNYRAVLNSPLFPNQPLYSNISLVKVRSCPVLSDLSLNIRNIQCTKPGSITLDSKGKNYSYELISTDNKTLTNNTGIFKNLGFGNYFLSIQSPSSCKISYPNKITIANEPCEEILISPNGDGYQDEYYFNQKGKAVLMDKFGNKLMDIELPSNWNGKVNNQHLAQGYYTLNVNDGETLVGITIVY